MGGPLFTPSSDAVVRVALPVPVDSLFDYAVGDDLAADATPGRRVQVRFRDRHLIGVIVSREAGDRNTRDLRRVEKVIDDEPVLSTDLIEILRETADEILCPVGIALAAALPSGSAPRIVPGYALTPRGREALAVHGVAGAARRLLERLAAGPRARSALLREKDGASTLRALERDRLVARQGIDRGPTARPATLRIAKLAAGVDADEAARGVLARAPQQASLLAHLAEAGETPVAALGERFPRVGPLLRSLRERGLVTVEERAAPRDVLGEPLEADRPVQLTAEQADALKPIASAVRERRFEAFLLHGVTGSGKTEIYLRAVGEALSAGRQALVLVPEITLTHQILARLRGRFGDDLAVLHSGLRPGERLEQWQRLRAGRTPIAVGARSALFAPLDDLGVIVIDEEQDGAYRNDEGFRYHARDLAMRRAERSGCPVVLGSATPDVATRFAADRGHMRRLVLSHRIGRRPLPAVEIVDLARERDLTPRGQRVVLSRSLYRALSETLAVGAQSLLLLNRRGFSTQVMCFACGYAARCEHCDIALVYHATEQRLRCHYCDFATAPPATCPGCSAPDFALLGIGTERLEEEVRMRFPAARIARLDRDTARRRGHVESVLRDLAAGDVDIVVGTQMIAKGHDFPGVRLVGVVMADTGLHLPDFRAAERTFQLLTQVAGRAGRDAAPGRVVIQTYAPEHYAVRLVRHHDYESFYAEELGHRGALAYPPFGRLVQVVVSSTDEARARAAAAELARSIEPSEPPSFEVLGPAPAPLARLRGRHRMQILIKGDDRRAVRAAGARLRRAAAGLPEGVEALVDVDPVSML
jgi:primosomal protein N' (replication factor Y)